MVKAAAAGTRIFSGIRLPNLTPVLFQTKCIGLVTMLMGTQKKINRSMMASQKRNGITQFLSWRWTTRLAIHHLNRISKCAKVLLAAAQLNLPSEDHADEDVEEKSVCCVEIGHIVTLGINLREVGVRRASALAHANLLFTIQSTALLDIMLAMEVTAVKGIVIGIRSWNDARLVVGRSGRIDDVVVVSGCSMRTVVEMGVVVFLCDVERGVVVTDNAWHWGAVVPLTREVDIGRLVSIGNTVGRHLLVARNIGHC